MMTLDRRGSGTRARAVRLDRNADRRVTAAGIVLAAGFVGAALVAAVAPVVLGAGAAPGWWLPLHLVLAGAAGTALGFLVSGGPGSTEPGTIGPGQAADLQARVGAICSLVGAWALAWHAVEVVRARGHWTTDVGWHRMATGGLVAASGWFAVAMLVAAGRVLLAGTTPAAWRLEDVLAPLAVGWALQTLVAAWTHLLPSIGPGGPPEHARQRMRLGWGTTARLAALNAGTALLAIGIPTGTSEVTAAGGALVVLALAVSLALVAGAFGEVRKLTAAAQR